MPSPEWLIDGILPQGAVAALYGAPATFKSFVAIDLALCVASGLPWHGKAVQQGPVLYIAAEGGAGIAKRVRAWLQHYEIKASAFDNVAWMIEAVSVLTGSDDLERLKMRLEYEVGQQPSLVIIDTLARCFDGDENQQEDMGAFVAGLDHIRKEYDATVLAIHHTNLGGERERGSTAFRGGADTMIAIDRPRHSKTATLECTKQKDAEDFEAIKLDFKAVEGSESGVLVDHRLPVNAQLENMLAILQEAGPQTTDDWLSLTRMSRATFHRQRARLGEMGKIIKENGMWRVFSSQPGSSANC